MLEGGNLRWDVQHCLTEGEFGSANFRPLTASSPPKQAGADARILGSSVLFKRKFPVPITLPVLSRRHPGEFSESRGKIMRILKSNVIGNLRDCVIRVRQLSHCAVHFGFQDELLQCHSGALVEEGGEVFVVVAEITGEFGDFEGLAAVVLDVADDVLQDLCPLRFGSVGAVEGALAVDFAENSGSQAVVEERVVETQGSVLELLHEDDDAVRGRKRSLARDA